MQAASRRLNPSETETIEDDALSLAERKSSSRLRTASVTALTLIREKPLKPRTAQHQLDQWFVTFRSLFSDVAPLATMRRRVEARALGLIRRVR